jgi:hypothetical protein
MVKDKFMDLCNPVLGEEKTLEIMEAFLNLENAKNMKKIIECCCHR